MSKLRPTQLALANRAHFQEVMSWFHSIQDVYQWGGPTFRYPFQDNGFIEDLELAEKPAYVLQGAEQQLLGFGQFYSRLERCHLGRLVINPQKRGQSLIDDLVVQLCAQADRSAHYQQASLFVLAANTAARNCYERLGFSYAIYEEVLDMEDCLFMVADMQHLLEHKSFKKL